MSGLFNRQRKTPPSPPLLYEWLSYRCPTLMAHEWGPMAFAMLAMTMMATLIPALVVTAASSAMNTPVSVGATLVVFMTFSLAGFWWVWVPLPTLWQWNDKMDNSLRYFAIQDLDSPYSMLALQVRWMLANKPEIATVLAEAMARRRAQQLWPADVMWLHEQLDEIDESRNIEGPTPLTAREQLEQWGLSSLVQSKSLEKSVKAVASDPSPPPRF